MADLLKDGGKALLLGNEAITRGLIESGVRFASTYPGTPSSEVGNILEKISEDAGLYFEFSVNEKVALETSAAAAVWPPSSARQNRFWTLTMPQASRKQCCCLYIVTTGIL